MISAVAAYPKNPFTRQMTSKTTFFLLFLSLFTLIIDKRESFCFVFWFLFLVVVVVCIFVFCFALCVFFFSFKFQFCRLILSISNEGKKSLGTDASRSTCIFYITARLKKPNESQSDH